MSLDLDLTTHLVWEKLTIIKPKVLVIEYNGFFPYHVSWQADVANQREWDGTYNMGASLNTINDISESKGYNLIGCDVTGTNAFFINEKYMENFNKCKVSDCFEAAKFFSSKFTITFKRLTNTLQ